MPPRVTACDAGDTESTKGAGLTTNRTVVASVTMPLVPVTLMVKFPAAEQAGTVIVDEPEPPVRQ